jgi:hypothetical protein
MQASFTEVLRRFTDNRVAETSLGDSFATWCPQEM